MSTTTEMRRGSAFPPAVDELMPRARELAARLGRVPSRNAVMRELRIGAEKAKAVLDELTAAETAGLRAGTVTTLPTARRPVTPKPSEPSEPEPTGPGGLVEVDAPSGQQPSDEPSPAAVVAASVPSVPSVPVPVVGPGVAGSVGRPVRSWPVFLLALPAFVAIWSGWVGLGGLTGFGVVHPLPGIADGFAINTAITLPVGMETYAAFALRAWLSGGVPVRARRFARWSAIASLVLGAAGQVAYHLMSAAGVTAAPWWITTVVACLPVAVLGMGAALAHLLHDADDHHESAHRVGEVTR